MTNDHLLLYQYEARPRMLRWGGVQPDPTHESEVISASRRDNVVDGIVENRDGACVLQ